jgi:hypothetical protein
MKKNLFIFLALSMGVQTFGSELSIYGGSGLSTFIKNAKEGNESFWFGGILGFGYTYFSTPSLGFGSGLEMTFYNAEYNLKKYNQPSYTFIDPSAGEMKFHSTIYGYKDEQSVMLLQIPFMLQYLHNYGGKLFYATAGTKIGIPLTGKSKVFADSIINSGHGEYTDAEYSSNIYKHRGFGTFPEQKSEKKLPLQTIVLLSAETGIKWKLNEELRLYTGIYFDYGLNSVTKRNFDRVVEYKNPDFVFNNLTDEIKPLAIGLKVKISNE